MIGLGVSVPQVVVNLVVMLDLPLSSGQETPLPDKSPLPDLAEVDNFDPSPCACAALFSNMAAQPRFHDFAQNFAQAARRFATDLGRGCQQAVTELATGEPVGGASLAARESLRDDAEQEDTRPPVVDDYDPTKMVIPQAPEITWAAQLQMELQQYQCATKTWGNKHGNKKADKNPELEQAHRDARRTLWAGLLETVHRGPVETPDSGPEKPWKSEEAKCEAMERALEGLDGKTQAALSVGALRGGGSGGSAKDRIVHWREVVGALYETENEEMGIEESVLPPL